jgi:uncharacterized iron-regulated membrane protein
MNRLIFNLHLFVALVAGLFVMILGITGAIMAFENELGEIVHASRVFVKPETRQMTLAEVGAIASNAFPGERIRGYRIPTRPNRSFGVVTERRTVYVNGYTGKILGAQTGPDPAANILGAIHQFHLRLLISNKADTGKELVRWSGVAMLFLLVSGVYLWWPQKRWWVRDWHAQAWANRSFWFDLHNAVGIFATAFLLILAMTGVAIGFERQTMSIFTRMTGTVPAYPPSVKVSPPPDAKPITPDQAFAIARAALPGAAPFDLSIPGPSGAYTVRARYPEDLTGGGRSLVVVDQYDGKVLFAQGSRTAPASVRMLTLDRALHTGDIFGLPSKVLMSTASLAAVFQMMSGVVMLWKRKRRKSVPQESRVNPRVGTRSS